MGRRTNFSLQFSALVSITAVPKDAPLSKNKGGKSLSLCRNGYITAAEIYAAAQSGGNCEQQHRRAGAEGLRELWGQKHRTQEGELREAWRGWDKACGTTLPK